MTCEQVWDSKKMMSEVGMEILIIVAVLVICVAVDSLLAKRADKAEYDHTVVERLSRYAGQQRQLG